MKPEQQRLRLVAPPRDAVEWHAQELGRVVQAVQRLVALKPSGQLLGGRIDRRLVLCAGAGCRVRLAGDADGGVVGPAFVGVVVGGTV